MIETEKTAQPCGLANVSCSEFTPQTAQQASALDQLMTFATGKHGARAMTLAGYAGTGKTTLVGELVRRLGQEMAIAVAAPTHKAVSVLREKVGEAAPAEFATLHSLLGLRLKPQHDGTYRCLPEGVPTIGEFALVIIDEASMVHRELFSLVMSPAYQGTRLLFVGDPAQLPPVEDAGETSMAFSRIQHQVMLTDVCRQAAEHPAIQLSMRIRAAIEQGVRLDAGRVASLCASRDADVLFGTGGGVTAFNWAFYDLKAGHDTRILAWRNRTVRAYNRDLHVALHGDATPFAVGETLMLNDSHGGRLDDGGDPMRALKVTLHNSEETVVHAITRALHPRHEDVSAWRIVVQRDNGQRAVLWIADNEDVRQAQISAMFRRASDIKRQMTAGFNAPLDAERVELIRKAWALREAFADARHVYAMTVHKSQGSTFDTAIVDVADLETCRGDEYNQLLYVAATRPRYHLAFIA
ncbi:MAG TPA: AAA family ATPase [Rhodanobacteraceae bacterium]|nr:AAA family ATPase [Rhodanobacteraceae bacterium]